MDMKMKSGRGTSNVAPLPLVAIGALVLGQLVFGGQVGLWGVKSGFMTVLTAFVAFRCGALRGCATGFAAGLLFDLVGSSSLVGVSSLLGSVMGYALGSEDRDVLAEGWVRPAVRFAVAALAYNVLYYAGLVFLGSGVEFEWALMGKALLSALLDILLAMAAFALAHRMGRRSDVGSSGLRLS